MTIRALIPAARVDMFINVVIVAAALFAAVAWGRVYFAPVPEPVPVQGHEVYQEGDIVPSLDSMGLSETTGAVIVNVLSTCPVCTDMASFYRQIAAARRTGGIAMPVVVISAEALPTVTDYAAAHRIEADKVISIANTEFKSRFVPTVYVVGPDRRIQRQWTGRMDDNKQADFWKHIQADPPQGS